MMSDETELTFLEKRISKRHPLWAMVSVSELLGDPMYTTSDIASDQFASCVNLSEDGMFLESFEKYPKGTVLSLEMDIPKEDDSAHYRLIGKVVHSCKLKKGSIQGVGVRFSKKTSNILEILD